MPDGSTASDIDAGSATSPAHPAPVPPAPSPDLGEALAPFSRRILREVAHLLRSPLGSMAMLAEVMQTPAESLTEPQRRKLKIIERAALGVAVTMGDLLALVDEGDASRVTRFSVSELLRVVADMVTPVAEGRSSRVEIQSHVVESRTGPALLLSRTLLRLALVGIQRTRDGTTRISATVGEGDLVTFATVASGSPDVGDDTSIDGLRPLRLDPGSGDYAVSPGGLRLGAARELARRMGTALDVDEELDGTVRLSFELPLPRAP